MGGREGKGRRRVRRQGREEEGVREKEGEHLNNRRGKEDREKEGEKSYTQPIITPCTCARVK